MMRLSDAVLNQVILYGGLPVRRCDVYRDALRRTGDKRAADMFAFGPQVTPLHRDTEPLSAAQLANLETTVD